MTTAASETLVAKAEGAQATATAQPQGSTATVGRKTGVWEAKAVVAQAAAGEIRGQLYLFEDGQECERLNIGWQ